MKTRKTWITILSILIVANIVFIWGNSLKSRSESQMLSLGVLQFIRPLLSAIFSPENVTDHLVRKLAHFTEFGALGAEFVLLTILLQKVKLQSVLNCLFAGLVVAVTDETIQIFSSRGSQVADIWIDFSGVVAGVLVILLIFAIVKSAKRSKESSAHSA
ncbi:MAG: VanZ family protein [Eubacteriales bacterium]|nr:VanZ family protein [Eubacteriales bacterium]